MAGSGISE